MTKLWVTLVIIGVLTLGMRISFILILGKWQQPRLLTRSLQFIPLAILSALILPDILTRGGQLITPPDPARIAGAGAACILAWKIKNIFITILGGMIAFYLVNYLF